MNSASTTKKKYSCLVSLTDVQFYLVLSSSITQLFLKDMQWWKCGESVVRIIVKMPCIIACLLVFTVVFPFKCVELTIWAWGFLFYFTVLSKNYGLCKISQMYCFHILKNVYSARKCYLCYRKENYSNITNHFF